ncbi:SETMAR [Cordylochernes scorpioides]|uniref:SETMAR n=1 Tax=Cordylochernes scorpioides TaxID=51811 RepID=A0ABY6LGB8_9ARAC|nr:SETMAR [Cordylochernes scorpioides]
MGPRNLRILLLCEFKLGRSAIQATKNIFEAWGEASSSERTTRRWFQKFEWRNDKFGSELSRFISHASEIVRKMLSLVNRKGVILLHDNARPHSSFTTQHNISELAYEVLAHPPTHVGISAVNLMVPILFK